MKIIPKEKVPVKIKTVSSVITGEVHVMTGGRLSDYMTTHNDKFIPVTDATVREINETKENGVKRKVIFVNVAMIERIEYL